MYRAITRVFLLGTCCLLPIAAHAEMITGPTGGGLPHENVQPSLAVNHLIALQGTYPSRNKDADPFLGEVTMFGGNFAPRGWALCDGQLLPIAQHTALFSLLGTTYGGDGRTTFGLPDLRGRTAIHPGSAAGGTDWRLGQRTGVEDVTLTVAQLPAHSHTLPSPPGMTDPTGGDLPHTNMQPSLGLNHTIALSGIYPSRNKGLDPFIGQIDMYAFNFAPRGWAMCDGQLLPITQNTALFSLLGTTYGGDGRTTFGLPDLQGRTPMHVGVGPGLTPRWLGQATGVEQLALTLGQMPAHDHTLPPSSDVTGDTGGGQPHTNMQPSLALHYIIALAGIYPTRNKGLEPFLGEINLFAGNFAPRGWAFCDGQLLPISQNDALFSLLGTTYGGDGRTSFALPDLRGRAAVHPGTGPGLTTWRLGDRVGVENVALTVNELPAHSHGYIPEPSTLLLGVSGLLALAFVAWRRRSRG